MRILTLIERLRSDIEWISVQYALETPGSPANFYTVKRFFRQEKWPRHGYPPNSDYFLKSVVKAKTLGEGFMY